MVGIPGHTYKQKRKKFLQGNIDNNDTTTPSKTIFVAKTKINKNMTIRQKSQWSHKKVIKNKQRTNLLNSGLSVGLAQCIPTKKNQFLKK